MVYRDPETGLFQSGDDDDYDYRDYEFQHVHSQYEVPADELPAALPIEESDIRSTNLDDLLDRNERADLVAVVVHSLQAAGTGTFSEETSLEARFELRAGVGSELVTAEDGNDEQVGDEDVVNATFWESDSPDVLYHAAWYSSAGFNDTAGGTGAGSDQPVLDQDVHFPREFGSCPQFDDRDEITESIYLNDTESAVADDGEIALEASYTLVFAVHDRD